MSDDHERTLRWGQTARTWLRKATAAFTYMHEQATSDAQRWALSYFAGRLFTEALDELETLARVVTDDDQVGDALKTLAEIERRLKAQRRASKLEQVAGRTPEEAAAFAAKAEELRR